MRKGLPRRIANAALQLLILAGAAFGLLALCRFKDSSTNPDLSEVFTVLLLLAAGWWILRARAVEEMGTRRLVVLVVLGLIVFFYIYPGVWRYTGDHDKLAGDWPISGFQIHY